MQTIGRFEVIGSLGQGSQGTVLLARDPDLDRKVAIKLMRVRGQPERQRGEMLREARAVSGLRHAGIVSVFEAGTQGRDPYLVFEHVNGPTLAKLLREQGALAPERAASICVDVLDALAHAHAAGIVHRDLKPSNVLIDEKGRARVMDFGIAARIGEPGDPSAGLIGTPAYMAPEYVARGAVTPQNDVYAAGLLLYEMLFGRRAFDGDGVFQVLHRVANEPLVMPPGAADIAGEALLDVLVKSTARDPDLRYPDARTMQQSLLRYLQPDGGTAASTGSGTLDFLLLRMRHKSDFPAMSAAIGTINQLALSSRSSAASLANAILKDLALTNKVLRLANSAFYGHAGGGRVSTVSRAIVILGFETVRNLAISLTLFENIRDKQHAAKLRDEFLRANHRGLLARALAEQNHPTLGEQAFICGLFHHLGRLLAQYYFREESDMVRRLQAAESCSEDQASRRLLGVSYEELGIGIARTWGFPDTLLHSMRAPPSGTLRAPQSEVEQMRLLAGCADTLGSADAATALKRYGPALGLSMASLQQASVTAGEQLAALAKVLNIDSDDAALQSLLGSDHARAAKDQTAGPASGAEASVIADAAEHAVVAPDQPTSGTAESVLAAGIQDISQALIDDSVKPADVLCAIAEIIFRALAARRVLVCLRDAATGSMRARHGFGSDLEPALKHLRFALGGKDLFNLSLVRELDVLVSDASAEKIRAHLPGWFREHFDAQSFIVLPLRLKQVPVAMIYAEAAKVDGVRVGPEVLALLRTLRNQALLAIRHAG
jgi:eukaryotic-like serine/threonine-protein kinase